MADDVDVTEFVGWVVTTARLYGCAAIRTDSYGISGGIDPDVILFMPTGVLAVKVKTRKATLASGARENGGLSERQARVRDSLLPSGARYVVWTPEDTGDALSVLSGSVSPEGANGAEASVPGALP